MAALLLGPHKVAPGPQKRQKWPFLACLGPQVPLFGGLRGPNWPLWMCLIMSSFVQIELLGVPMAKNGHFRPKMAVLDLLVPLFGGPKGPNKPPWMCYTMSKHVQPMSNPLGSVGGVYGQKWPFWTPTKNQTFHDNGKLCISAFCTYPNIRVFQNWQVVRILLTPGDRSESLYWHCVLSLHRELWR